MTGRVAEYLMAGLFLAAPALAEVQVYVEAGNGEALLKYECSAGEVVCAFPLDVTLKHNDLLGGAPRRFYRVGSS